MAIEALLAELNWHWPAGRHSTAWYLAPDRTITRLAGGNINPLPPMAVTKKAVAEKRVAAGDYWERVNRA